jgi:hypothetical protein
MGVEGLVRLIELLRQRKPNDVVVAHHSDPRVGLPVLPQQGLHTVSPVPQVRGRLVDPRLKHHRENGLHDLLIGLVLVLREHLGVGSLVHLTLVFEKPKRTLLLHPFEVVAGVELFLRVDVCAEVAGATDSLREDWFDDDGTVGIGEDE